MSDTDVNLHLFAFFIHDLFKAARRKIAKGFKNAFNYYMEETYQVKFNYFLLSTNEKKQDQIELTFSLTLLLQKFEETHNKTFLPPI